MEMKRLLLILLLIYSGNAYSQHEGTFYFMNTISQSTYYNPAFTPKYNTTIGLPGISSNYFGVLNSGFSYNDLISRRAEDDSLVVTLDKFYDKLKDKNHLKGETMADLFHLSFKLNPRMHFTLNVTNKTNIHLVYPKEIANLLINGNVPNIGKDAEFSITVNGSGYIETGVGLNYEINHMWSVGTRFKYLKGYTNITTKQADFTINTADNYHIQLKGDALIQTAGLSNLEDEELDNFSDFMGLINNNGFGLDLGASFRPSDRFTFGLALVDLGKIKRNNAVTEYVLNPETADFTFRGVDIAELLEDDSDLEFDLDSLEEKFKFQEVNGSAYSSILPAKIYLSGSYELCRNLYTSVLLSGQKNKGSFNMAATANITKHVGKAMTLAVSYTASQNSYKNIGAGLSFNLAPLQLYVAGDNLFGAATTAISGKDINSHINGMQYFNLRFGINFIGAWQKTTEKLSDDKLF